MHERKRTRLMNEFVKHNFTDNKSQYDINSISNHRLVFIDNLEARISAFVKDFYPESNFKLDDGTRITELWYEDTKHLKHNRESADIQRYEIDIATQNDSVRVNEGDSFIQKATFQGLVNPSENSAEMLFVMIGTNSFSISYHAEPLNALFSIQLNNILKNVNMEKINLFYFLMYGTCNWLLGKNYND